MRQYLLFLMIASVLVVTGCSQQGGDAGVGGDSDVLSNTLKEEIIKIGVLAPLSGPASTYGEDVVHGYNHVVSKINKAGGIDGKEVKLIVEDGKCNGKDATTAIQKLLTVDGVKVIAGGQCSSETIPAGKIAQQYKVPMISPLSSSPEISSIGEYVFRYRNDADAGRTMVDYMSDNGAEKIALLYENTDYAVAYARVITDTFGGEIVVEEKFASEEKDFGILAKRVVDVADDIDYLVFIPQAEANVIPFIKALENESAWEGLRSKFLGTETVLSDGVVAELGDMVEGMKGVRFPELAMFGDDVVAATTDLLAGYEVKTSDIFVLFAADSLEMIADAIESQGYDSDAIKQYIASFTSDNKRDSIFGEFWFDEEGDGQGLPFVLVEVKDGQVMSVKEGSQEETTEQQEE